MNTVPSYAANPSLLVVGDIEPPAVAGLPSSAVVVSRADEHSGFAKIASAPSGVLYLAWESRVGASRVIMVAISSDRGRTWASPETLSAPHENARYPEIVADGRGRAVVTWFHAGSDESVVMACTSDDDGTTWSEPVQLSAEGYRATTPTVDAVGDAFIVLWPGTERHSAAVQMTISRDGGRSWTRPATVPALGQFATIPRISGGGAGVFAVTGVLDGIVRSSASPDEGRTWSASAELSPLNGSFPQVAVGEELVVVAWHVYVQNSLQVQVASSSDSGLSWSAPETISHGRATFPQVAMGAGRLVAAIWTGAEAGTTVIQAAVSADAAQHWDLPVTVSDPGQYASNPQIVVTSDNTLFAVWASTRAIKAAASSDLGLTWSAPVTLSEPGTDAAAPLLVATEAGAVVSWSQGTGSNDVIVAKTVSLSDFAV